MMVRLLVSVRDLGEALAAAGAGAQFIDLKEPSDGALGALAPERIAQLVPVLRERYPGVHISATVGDLPASWADEILRRVHQVAALGVDYVKVGLWPGVEAAPLLDALAAAPARIVPVLVVDGGVDLALVAQAVARRAFPALMVDTAEKGRGSLLERVPPATLAAFIAAVRSHGMLAGLAGSLRIVDAPALQVLAPDFAGFRGAVSRGDRTGALAPRLVRELRSRLAPWAGANDPRADAA
jgi:uncharacterized protein (UPF0264 family)